MDEIKELLYKNSLQYKEKWQKICKDNPKQKNRVLGQTIEDTKLYQLCEDSNVWLYQLNDN